MFAWPPVPLPLPFDPERNAEQHQLGGAFQPSHPVKAPTNHQTAFEMNNHPPPSRQPPSLALYSIHPLALGRGWGGRRLHDDKCDEHNGPRSRHDKGRDDGHEVDVALAVVTPPPVDEGEGCPYHAEHVGRARPGDAHDGDGEVVRGAGGEDGLDRHVDLLEAYRCHFGGFRVVVFFSFLLVGCGE